MDNQLKDVAKGAVVFPQTKTFHTVPMDENMLRVRVDRALPGCEDMHPLTQPPEQVEMLKVGQLKNKMLLWPKALIRLNNAVSRSEASHGSVNPEAAPGPSSQAIVTPPADDPLEPETQHNERALDIDRAPIDTFIDELAGDFGPSTAPARDTLKKKLFPSQETPEQEDTTAFTAPPQVGLTPRTLLGATMDEMKQAGTPPCLKKKNRKRKKKSVNDAAASKKVLLDKVSTPWRKLHHLGQPMLPANIVSQLTPDMRTLHEAVLTRETRLLGQPNPSYPVITARVPTNFGFVTTYPADLIFIRYEDIFRLFHMQRLDRNLVRLVTLSLAHDLIVEKIPGVAIMDPFYMTPGTTANEQAFLATYVKDFLVANKDKQCFLIPYFPE
jgi:hypothetical protein